ncbi:MAG: hypothetical protein K2M46_13895 [Lachnospiraceae bacterium]|nr:hypothetical protein [Lachnospiraceae bacterium]
MKILKEYFERVPMWLVLTNNIIVGILSSVLSLIGAIYFFGLLESSFVEKVIGIVIFAGIFLLFIGTNYVIYKICSVVSKNKKHNMTSKRVILRLVIALFVLITLILSFFILPDFWLALNSFWF